MERATAKRQARFNDKLVGRRRKLAIGTMNKLVDQHNAAVQRPSQAAQRRP